MNEKEKNTISQGVMELLEREYTPQLNELSDISDYEDLKAWVYHYVLADNLCSELLNEKNIEELVENLWAKFDALEEMELEDYYPEPSRL